MQYTAKVALLAVALFGTSVLAVPFGSNAEYDLEAREVENDLSAREFFEMYLEARANPSLSARDLESMDLEAREYLEYLEARDAANAPSSPQAGSQVPSASAPPTEPPAASTSSTSSVTEVVSEEKNKSVTEVVQDSTGNPEHHHKHHHKHHKFLTPYREAQRADEEAALLELKSDPKLFQNALMNSDDKLHRYAVKEYLLLNPTAYHEALENEGSPFHKMAKRIRHRRAAMKYLESPENYKKALRHRHDKYHSYALRKYFSKRRHFMDALKDIKSRFHNAAVMEYLRFEPIRLEVLAHPGSQFYKMAVRLQKKIDMQHHEHHGHHHHHHHHKGHESTVSASSEVPIAPAPQPA